MYWSFSFNISPSNEQPGLISFRMDWLDLLAIQGALKSLFQHHSSKAPIFWRSAFFTVQLSHPYITTGKIIALTRWTFVGKVMSLLFRMHVICKPFPDYRHLKSEKPQLPPWEYAVCPSEWAKRGTWQTFLVDHGVLSCTLSSWHQDRIPLSPPNISPVFIPMSSPQFKHNMAPTSYLVSLSSYCLLHTILYTTTGMVFSKHATEHITSLSPGDKRR